MKLFNLRKPTVIRFLIFFGIFLLKNYSAQSQTGNNALQITGQFAVPTGELATIVKPGQGYSVKFLWGFSSTGQQLSLEVGNSFFDVKDEFINKQISAYYFSWPIYAGYRHYLKHFYLEGQLGIAFNTITAFKNDTISSAKKTDKYASFAIGTGYQLQNFEFE